MADVAEPGQLIINTTMLHENNNNKPEDIPKEESWTLYTPLRFLPFFVLLWSTYKHGLLDSNDA